MNIKTTLKTSVAVAALFAVAVPVAEAGNVSNGNGNSLTISGQVNKAVMYMDNGEQDKMAIIDSDESGTRFRMVGKGQINEAWSVGTNIEMEVQSRGGNNVSPVDGNANGLATTAAGETTAGQTTFNERVAEISFSHKQFGTLSLGQGSEAADGVSFSDMSGTFLAIDSGMTFDGLGINLHVSGSTKNSASTVTVGNFLSSHDGGRDDRIRYDTPSFGGLSLATSMSAGGESQVAAFYGGKFGGIAVSASAGFMTGVAGDTFGVSAAAKHDSGINVWAGYGNQDNETTAGTTRKNDTHVNAGIGYSANLVSAGATNFGFAYGNFEDVGQDGDEMTSYGIGVVQNISAAGTEIYAGATQWDIKRTGTNFDDPKVVKVGARIKF